MTQDKLRKVITACVSAATVLLTVLLSYLIYQWATIAVYNKRIDKLEAEVVYWTEVRDNALDEEEYVRSDYFLRQAALELQMQIQQGKK